MTRAHVDADAFLAEIDTFAVQLDNVAEDFIHDLGDIFKAKLVFKIQRGSPSGRTYQRGTKTHRASAPDQAPASDTGRLVASIFVDNLPGAVVIGSNLAYAAILERGNMTSGGYIAPRPAWLPAMNELNREIEREAEKRLAPVMR